MEYPLIRALFRRAVHNQQIMVSLHAAEEALAEGITRSEIEDVMLDAAVLEDYPDWWLGPACLIGGRTGAGRPLHIVASCSGLPVTLITVYEPRPPRWITPYQRGGEHKR